MFHVPGFIDSQFILINCFPSSVYVADRGGKSFLTSQAIYRVYIVLSTVCIFVRAQRERISYQSCQK